MHDFLLLIFAAMVGVGLFLAFYVVCRLLMALNWYFRDRPVEEAVATEFPMGQAAIFTGRYIAHWERAHFAWHKDGKAPRDEHRALKCELVISDEEGWSRATREINPDPLRDDTFYEWREFDLEFRGKIIEKGRFGHLGLCRYKIEVLEVISARPATEDNPNLLHSNVTAEAPSDALLRPARESSQTSPKTLLPSRENEDDD